MWSVVGMLGVGFLQILELGGRGSGVIGWTLGCAF